MAQKLHRAEILQKYLDNGIDPAAAIEKLKLEHPEYSPRHRDAKGEPLTFEAVVSDYMKQGLSPDVAVRAAVASDGVLQRDYYDRLRVGAASDLEWILKGHAV